jgi:uncharacterized membrane protein
MDDHNASSSDDPLIARARKRVSLKLGFYTHALIYVLVNAGLFLLSSMQGRHWAIWPLAGWGIGLAVHGVFTLIGLQGEGLRDRMIQREAERLRGK